MTNISSNFSSGDFLSRSSTRIFTESPAFLVMSLTGLIENVITIIVLYKSEKIPFQIKALSLCLNFADTNLCFALCVNRDFFVYIFSCGVQKYLFHLATRASLLTATVMNIDRCLFIVFGLRYVQALTKLRTRLVCITIWVIAVLLSYTRFYHQDGSHLHVFCSPGNLFPDNPVRITSRVCCKIVLFINLPIFAFIIYQIMSRDNFVPVMSEERIVFSRCDSERRRNLITISAISGVLLFAYLPSAIADEFLQRLQAGNMRSISMALRIIILLSSLINPILYVWRFYEIRYQFKKLIFFWNKEKLEILKNERKQYFATYVINSRSSSVVQNIMNRGRRNSSETDVTYL